MLQTYKGKED